MSRTFQYDGSYDYTPLRCLMEVLKKEKESQTACPKCGEAEENSRILTFHHYFSTET